MNFTAHRINTGLRGIFNGFSVEIFLKNDSSPQITNLARINTGIAEMLFGRTETPKGIGTYHLNTFCLILCLEEQKPQRGLELLCAHFMTTKPQKFGRTETPKGIGTFLLLFSSLNSCLEEQKPQRGLEPK